jgi:hypothetical protein
MPTSSQAPAPAAHAEQQKEQKTQTQAAQAAQKQPSASQPGHASAQKQQEISDAEKQKLLQLSEISIIIDTYDDIFSDFDPRPYDARSLSDDFISVVRKAARQKGSKIELKVMVPEQLRKPELESVIKKRIKAHYRSAAEQLRKDVEKTRQKGGLFILAGVVILTLAVALLSAVPEGFAQTFLLFLLEPAGWFTIWNGFDYLFIQPASRKDEHEFYAKLANSEITFVPY